MKPLNEPVVELALETIKLKKQALVFVNTKRSAEHCAEIIAKQLEGRGLEALSNKVTNVLPSPTSQCIKLGKCIQKGVAFHHAGLHAKQRRLVEEAFRNGSVNILCCTTTMAAGVDLPAFRSIIRDVRRYGHHGLELIPVLEYHQAAGRAGRPGKEKFGEAIAIAKTEAEKEEIINTFIKGTPEKIFSKLAVEPVLRTYLLSLVATGIVSTQKQLLDFFSKTFWAKQFGDFGALNSTILKVQKQLEDWGFIYGGSNTGFVSGSEVNSSKLQATLLGKRVAQLYLDPLAAHQLVSGLQRMKGKQISEFSLLQLICYTLEMRPLLRVKTSEYDTYQELLTRYLPELLVEVPSYFEPQYESFIRAVKTATMLREWIQESSEEELMERFGSRPGETRYKLDIADWLLYSLKELAIVLRQTEHNKDIEKLRIRLKYGVKEELIPLLRLKGIGRVRARKLYNNGIKDLGGIRRCPLSELRYLIGEKTAVNVKKQVGQDS